MYLQPEDLLKIVLAVLVGGLIGIEREYRDKAAGFRTLIFICVGATLFTILSVRLAGDNDPTRIAASIVTGVGFLGAGVILRDGGRVIGLTTAAAIWLTAALGVGLGGGLYALVGVSTVLALIVLWVLPFFEHRLDNLWEERTYEIVCALAPEKVVELEHLFAQNKLRVKTHRLTRSGGEMTLNLLVRGPLKGHEKALEQIFARDDVHTCRY